MAVKRPLKERFEEKVSVSPNGCWDWTAHVALTGYGTISVKPGTVRYAHRISYELFVGPIPEGLSIHHTCRNRKCVNPDHLEPVTHLENTRKRGRYYAVDPKWLREQYVDNELSTVDIGKMLGCPSRTVWDLLRRHGIKIRPRGVFTQVARQKISAAARRG